MSSSQEGLTLGVNANQSALTFEVACGQTDGRLEQNSKQVMLTFTKGSKITDCIIPTGLIFQNITFDVKTDINNTDFSSATLVYQDFPKTIYKRPDGTNKLRYYNNSDTLVFADVND